MFSELVDTIIQRTGQGAARKQADIVAYANSTLRELIMKALFHRDFYEDSETATAQPHVMQKPTRFRQMRAVKYQTSGIYPKFCFPGVDLAKYDYSWYAADTYFVFAGMEVDETIALAYYRYPRRFTYYVAAERPATYSELTESWSYLAAYDTNDTVRATARDLVGHWLLQYWNEVVQEGTMAKILKNVNDQQRASNSFALFKDLQGDILKAESYESIRPAGI